MGSGNIGKTFADSFAPNGQFQPWALVLPPLRQKFADTQKAIDEENKSQALYRKIQGDQMISSVAQTAIQTQGPAAQSALGQKLGGFAAEQAAPEAQAKRINFPGIQGNYYSGPQAEQAAQAEEQERTARGLDQPTIVQREQARQAANRQIPVAPELLATMTPEQQREMAVTQATQTIGTQQANARETFATQQAVSEARQKATIAETSAQNIARAQTITPSQFDQAMANLDRVDPTIFDSNPVMKGAVAFAKAMRLAAPDSPPQVIANLSNSLMDAAVRGVTRQQTQVVDNVALRGLAEKEDSILNSIGSMATVRNLLDQHEAKVAKGQSQPWVNWNANMRYWFSQTRDSLGNLSPEEQQDLTEWTNFRNLTEYEAQQYVYDIAATTFTEALAARLRGTIATTDDISPTIFRAKLSTMEAYKATKLARIQARRAQLGGRELTQEENRQIIEQTLLDTALPAVNENGTFRGAEALGITPDLSTVTEEQLRQAIGGQ